jgi:hypothetical protein
VGCPLCALGLETLDYYSPVISAFGVLSADALEMEAA